MDSPEDKSKAHLTPEEELLLQQLLQVRFWQDRNGLVVHMPNEANQKGQFASLAGDLDHWDLTRGLTLHGWQEQCVARWFESGKRGVLKVVTGAGKTVLALAIAERLQQTENPHLRVAVVVPTIVLLQQWYDELTARSNLPPGSIGLMGSGCNDGFNQNVRILICVLNSASRKLSHEVERAGISQHLLLIIDECHRAGAAEMRRVFGTKRAYSLGLSATPEREDDPSSVENIESMTEVEEVESPQFDDSVIGMELGRVIFELNYADAIRLGVLPPFKVVHYGLALQPQEKSRYERLSREIKDLRADLETPKIRGLALIRWCRSRAAADNPKAARLVSLTTERKRLLYRMEQRSAAVLEILRTTLLQNEDTKAILFHESIDEVMALFGMLRNAGYHVVAEHSAFPDHLRAESLRLFRNGTARIIVSARSLIEGFNLPAADLGIIVAASSSVRQRVQTLGRLLRRSKRADGSEKHATLYVLYSRDTVDELIYEKADWNRFIGAERNEYFVWPDVNGSIPILCDAPPRIPLPDEGAVDVLALRPGEPYPGNPEQGQLYSIDSQSTVRDEKGTLLNPNEQLHAMLARFSPKGGRFRITPTKRYVIKLEKTRDGWQSLYLGQLAIPIETVSAQQSSEDDHPSYLFNSPYPLDRVKGKTFSVLQRDSRLIARRTSSGIRFVIPIDQISDSKKRALLGQIQAHLTDIISRGYRINKITVTKEGHVVYVYQNRAHFIGYAPEGEEGFAFEGEQNL